VAALGHTISLWEGNERILPGGGVLLLEFWKKISARLSAIGLPSPLFLSLLFLCLTLFLFPSFSASSRLPVFFVCLLLFVSSLCYSFFSFCSVCVYFVSCVCLFFWFPLYFLFFCVLRPCFRVGSPCLLHNVSLSLSCASLVFLSVSFFSCSCLFPSLLVMPFLRLL